jgi:hypothetical protein
MLWIAFAIGAVGLVAVNRDESYGGLFVPAGALIVLAAVLDREPSFGDQYHMDSHSPRFRRGLALAVGSLWAFLGAWLLLNG